MQKFKVEKNDSSDLAFAHSCLLAGAISRTEFSQWVYWVIENSAGDLPSYVFELDEMDGSPRSFYSIVGFVPCSDLTDAEQNAIDGIAFDRGADLRPKSAPAIGRIRV